MKIDEISSFFLNVLSPILHYHVIPSKLLLYRLGQFIGRLLRWNTNYFEFHKFQIRSFSSNPPFAAIFRTKNRIKPDSRMRILANFRQSTATSSWIRLSKNSPVIKNVLLPWDLLLRYSTFCEMGNLKSNE